GVSGGDAELNRRRTERGPDDLATIIYTSGTTGRPRGCRILHRNFGYGVANGLTVLPQAFNPDASTLLYLPLAHVLAREIQCGAIETQTAISYTPDTAHLLDDLGRFSPTTLLVIPRVLERLWGGARQKALEAKKGRIFDAAAAVAVAYSEAADTGSIGLGLRAKHALFNVLIDRKLRRALGGRCSAVISGGAPLSARLGRFFHGAGIEIYEGYGLTETSAACAVNSPRERKFGTVGRPLPGVSVRIADGGEILMKGDLVFDGYWNDPETSAEALRGGWLHTGDLGNLDADGYLAVTGRKKELIVTSSGKNVAPTPMEEALRAHPLVSQCVVIGDNRPFISCLVTLDPNGLAAWRRLNPSLDNADNETAVRAAIQEAVDEVNATVSRAEAIKVFHILPGDFTVEGGELTPSLKVRKSVVADHYADEIAAMYG
ncbi:MAG: AMP-dependent synthetase/ligase, partial [Mycobacteriales bacterium]